jgi:hypothetical protein
LSYLLCIRKTASFITTKKKHPKFKPSTLHGSRELEKCKSFYCSCKNDIHGVHSVRAIFTRLPSLMIKIIGQLSVTYFDVVNTVFAGAKNLPPCYKAL